MKCLAAPVLAMALMAASQASAQNWAQKMFAESRHDFGTVARDSKTEYEFTFQNLYQEEVRIASIRSSCGCTTPILKDGKRAYKSWEKGTIIAHVNSGKFLGSKGATLTITFDKPMLAEAQVQVSVFIRNDIVCNPSSLQFGAVEQGNPAVTRLAIAAYNRPGWQIQDIKTDNPHLKAELVEFERNARSATYHISVRLDDEVPAGDIRQHIRLMTNDPQQPELPVLVEGRVLSTVTVGPRMLAMGVVKPGSKVTKPMVVRAKEPFRITAIRTEGQGFEFPSRAGGEAKTVHVVPVTFIAGSEPGKIHQTIRVETDLDGASGQLAAHAIVAGEPAAEAEPQTAEAASESTNESVAEQPQPPSPSREGVTARPNGLRARLTRAGLAAEGNLDPVKASPPHDSQEDAQAANSDNPRRGPIARALRFGRTRAGRGW